MLWTVRSMIGHTSCKSTAIIYYETYILYILRNSYKVTTIFLQPVNDKREEKHGLNTYNLTIHSYLMNFLNNTNQTMEMF